MEPAAGGRVFMISAILALTAAAGELTQTPITDSLRTFNAFHNQSDAVETVSPAERGDLGVPQALTLKQACHEIDQSYCMNGICKYYEDQDQNNRHRICICKAGYNGERCQHMVLTSHTTPKSERYLYLAVGIGIGLFLSAFAVILYYCVRQRCQESKTTYSKCSGVASV
uniref:epigen-like n=1 Tax=Pristiophorus japonicus TaxID=55135 RepID=UPI00398E744B